VFKSLSGYDSRPHLSANLLAFARPAGALLLGAKALAFTGYDLLTDPQLLRKVQAEFAGRAK
jgi:hypothetical protein